jgi:hypothetical protein
LDEIFGVVGAVLFDVFFHDAVEILFAGLGSGLEPAWAIPVHAAVGVEILPVLMA